MTQTLHACERAPECRAASVRVSNHYWYGGRCRAAVGDVVKALFGAVGQSGVDRLARYLTDWLAGSNTRLQRTAAQVHPSKDPWTLGPLLASALAPLSLTNLLTDSCFVWCVQKPPDTTVNSGLTSSRPSLQSCGLRCVVGKR